jgi:aryl-alcohol dehydrogenase-like predicted oxidoreductase
MNYRTLGKTGFNVSELSLGTWQLGGVWGTGFDHASAQRLLDAAYDEGVNFFDTADVYEDGESEKAVGTFLAKKGSSANIKVATKCGKRINPFTNEHFSPEVLRGHVEDSLQRLGVETIDLIQLHCPPTEVYYRPEIFGLFDRLKEEGKIQHLGVSVEKVEEAVKAIQFDNVTTVQIIYNLFRQRPNDYFFDMAKEKNIGIIVRVPLASGLLSGKMTRQSTFNPNDHRHGNRNGEWFDKGETFAGVPFEIGLEAVEKLREIFSGYDSLAQVALKWILLNQKISVIIPGASKLPHIPSNMTAGNLPDFTPDQLTAAQHVYDSMIKHHVHDLW